MIRMRMAGAIAIGVASVAACGGDDDSGAGDGAVTITWWTGQTDAAAEILVGLADEYHAAHPDVTVRVEQGATPDDMRAKLEVALSTDTYPDAAYVYGSDASALARSDKVVDLTDEVADPSVAWEDFWGSEREAATVDGRVVAFPAVVGDLGVIYNRSVFTAAGVAEPTADWTWDDFRATASALTDPDAKVFGAAYNVSGSEGTVAPFWPMVWQQGLDILAPDGETVGFDDPKVVAALDLLRGMAIDDESLFLDQNGESTESLFANGKIGMMISGPWSLATLVDAKAEYGVQVLPGYGGNHETTGGQDLWMLFDHDDEARTAATAAFVNWITQAEQDARWSIEQFNLPIRASSKQRPEFQRISTELPGYADFVANLDNAKRARPPIEAYPDVSLALGEQIAAVLLDQADAETAVATAAEAGDAALAEARSG